MIFKSYVEMKVCGGNLEIKIGQQTCILFESFAVGSEQYTKLS